MRSDFRLWVAKVHMSLGDWPFSLRSGPDFRQETSEGRGGRRIVGRGDLGKGRLLLQIRSKFFRRWLLTKEAVADNAFPA